MRDFVAINQPVRLLVSAVAYQPWYNIFLSQQTSTSQAYQPKNQPANGNNGNQETSITLHDNTQIYLEQ